MRAQAAPGFVLRGWHVLAMMLGFFGAVIAVNIAFAVFAVGTFPGEDVRHSYLQGLNYNETLAERHAQAATGWRAEAGLTKEGADTVLRVALLTRDGAPIEDARVEGALRWPTDSRRDRALTFQSRGHGVYVAPLGNLPDGDWRLRARAETPHGALDFESELAWIPQP